MKKLIIILSMLFGIAEMQAQTITYTPQAAAGYRFKYAIVDSGFTVPFGDTTTGRGSVRPGAIKLFEADSLLYFWNGLKWTKVNAGSISGPDIDSIVFTASTICKWFEGASTCFDLGLVHANATLNFNGTGITFYNLEGTALGDSVALPHTDVYDGSEIYWVDSAGGVIAKLRAGAGGGGSGTTDYAIQTASGSNDFTFPSVPASMDDFIIRVNGASIRPTTDYTKSGNIVTIPQIDIGDVVEFIRIK